MKTRHLNKVVFIVFLLSLTSCAHDALTYIPKTDRDFIQAQTRVDVDGVSSKGGITVGELLAKAKDGDDSYKLKGLTTVTFEDDTVVLTDNQKNDIQYVSNMAKKLGWATVVGYRDSSNNFLGQRRAIAVARYMEKDVPHVVLKFNNDVSPNQVIVTSGKMKEEAKSDLPSNNED